MGELGGRSPPAGLSLGCAGFGFWVWVWDKVFGLRLRTKHIIDKRKNNPHVRVETKLIKFRIFFGNFNFGAEEIEDMVI